MDSVARLFSKHERKRKPKMKVHVNNTANGRKADYAYNAQKKERTDEIDRILEKLKKSGYSSLSEEEKRKLFEASKR